MKEEAGRWFRGQLRHKPHFVRTETCWNSVYEYYTTDLAEAAGDELEEIEFSIYLYYHLFLSRKDFCFWVSLASESETLDTSHPAIGKIWFLWFIYLEKEDLKQNVRGARSVYTGNISPAGPINWARRLKICNNCKFSRLSYHLQHAECHVCNVRHKLSYLAKQ